MKSTFLACTILSIISLNWMVFTAENGAFSILSPAPLDLTVKAIPTQLGEVQWHTYTHQVPDSTEQVFLYSVTYYEYPDLLISSDSSEMVDQFFSETLDAIAERIDGEIVYSETIQHKEFPAKLSRIIYQDGAYSLKNKLILANNKFYLIEVFSSASNSLDTKINKFIESFTLLQQ